MNKRKWLLPAIACLFLLMAGAAALTVSNTFRPAHAAVGQPGPAANQNVNNEDYTDCVITGEAGTQISLDCPPLPAAKCPTFHPLDRYCLPQNNQHSYVNVFLTQPGTATQPPVAGNGPGSDQTANGEDYRDCKVVTDGGTYWNLTCPPKSPCVNVPADRSCLSTTTLYNIQKKQTPPQPVQSGVQMTTKPGPGGTVINVLTATSTINLSDAQVMLHNYVAQHGCGTSQERYDLNTPGAYKAYYEGITCSR